MSSVITLASLASADYELQNLFVLRQYWKHQERFRMTAARPTHAFLLFSGCDAVYETSEKRIAVARGSLFYLAKGDQYTWTFLNPEEKAPSTLLFEFSPTGNALLQGESGIIDPGGASLWLPLFENLLSEFEKPALSRTRMKIAAYSFTAAVGDHLQRANDAPPFCYIRQGIRYLEEDPLQEKSIREVASLCNVSINYFERLFRDYAGMSPVRFRLCKKIEKAKRLLESQTLSIEEIALSLGFDDPAYFCRVFKKMTAQTPRAYQRAMHPSAKNP